MLNFNILANIEADNRLQKTAYLKKKKKKKKGDWTRRRINCLTKLTSFRRGVYVIVGKFSEFRNFLKDLFATL